MATISRHGRRFTLKQAAEYLDWPVYRLRQAVRRGQVAYTRTQTAQIGRLEFREADLLAFVASLRTPVRVLPAPRRSDASIDDAIMATLAPEDQVFR